ncbi:hypothetical protein Fleli_3311 [Bernardetia litoralis DSM 6794]|uniref:Uncharacterized protein n=1 Tax=Bernardetia litoralis (strain ATCC 23117 / DSM 6794 / NBRC 15988 / NCIMB 1366 / Fx l1 / Sio-4) TaxID=880071 RepID=I4ANV5_BERLS|nr:hypothetical protein [Bernardetia litoralis]AFM05640.1 hypothetical protein Fleli_3311 [Bernardetia litoralis DSM 6794]
MKESKIYFLTLESFEKFKDNIPYSSNLYEFVSEEILDSEYKKLEELAIPLNGLDDLSLSFSLKRNFLVYDRNNERTELIKYIPVHRKSPSKLPNHIHTLDKTIQFPFSSKIAKSKNLFYSIRKMCLKHICYKIKVEIDNNELGYDAKVDKDIEIDSLGKWLFGVPNWKGNIQIQIDDESYTISFPSTIPYVEQMLRESLQ